MRSSLVSKFLNVINGKQWRSYFWLQCKYSLEECVVNQSAGTRHTQIPAVIFVSVELDSATSNVGTIVKSWRRKTEDSLELNNQIFRVSSLPHAAPIVELVHGPLVESEKDGVVAEPVVEVPGVRVANKKNHPKKPTKTHP